ncbi:MAG: hypothetical protein AAF682_16780 [Planctomycetota bacterium]
MFVFLHEARNVVALLEQVTPPHADIYTWIVADDPYAAELRARELIREAGWAPLQLVEGRRVERTDYADEPEALELFDEAAELGNCMVIWGRAEELPIRCPVHDPPA